jgi:hypothetical protein
VEGDNNYATCSGWPKDSVPAGIPDHDSAPYGHGLFNFSVKYQSAATQTCIEDANAGIGNNCTKADAQNPKHGGSGGSTPPGASRACALNSASGGTTLTYQFACADGVSVTGFLTLAPTIDGNPQANPSGTDGSFTNCDTARIAAGECTMRLGGIPSTTTKVKGQNVTVVDAAACAAAFPAQSVVNAFNSGQTQTLDLNELLFYKEVASEGTCDPVTNLPTVPGLPAAAYGRYCQSDLGPLPSGLEGFDNVLRVCPVDVINKVAYQHTGAQDVEQVALRGGVKLEPQGPMNLNCSTGGNTDSGKYKVYLVEQAPLLVGDIDITPANAPKLEGISPLSATIVVGDDGVKRLLLTYPTCSSVPGEGLSANIINKYHPTNNSDVTLELTGQTYGAGADSLGPIQFKGEFTIKVNGL